MADNAGMMIDPAKSVWRRGFADMRRRGRLIATGELFICDHASHPGCKDPDCGTWCKICYKPLLFSTEEIKNNARKHLGWVWQLCEEHLEDELARRENLDARPLVVNRAYIGLVGRI